MGYFKSSEFYFSLKNNVFDQDITIFQSFHVDNFHNDLFALMRICSTLKANHAKKIVLFAPFIPYARQDKSNQSGESGFGFFADILENKCNIDRIVTYDLHTKSIDQFFHRCCVSNMSMIPSFVKDIDARGMNNVLIVFPDSGSQDRASMYLKDIHFHSVTIDKTRAANGSIDSMKITYSSNIENFTAIIIDDIIDSGDTIIKASEILWQNGVRVIHVYATHGLFSGDAVEKLENSKINSICVSNSLRVEKYLSQKIMVLNIPIFRVLD